MNTDVFKHAAKKAAFIHCFSGTENSTTIVHFICTLFLTASACLFNDVPSGQQQDKGIYGFSAVYR